MAVLCLDVGDRATSAHIATGEFSLDKDDSALSRLVTTFAYLMNPNNPGADETTKEIREAARQLGRSVDIMGAGTASEIDAAFMALAEHRTGAFVVMADQYFDESRRAQLVALAARHAIPTIYRQRDYVVEGGLISYGTDLEETHRQAGIYAVRIPWLQATFAGVPPAARPVHPSGRAAGRGMISPRASCCGQLRRSAGRRRWQ